ncbi:MAG: hypothetical protein FWF84_03195 [Kiritimatiellaeota bacterium]|nr:hypothetical protein [Kiritimatiellota bacterium]
MTNKERIFTILNYGGTVDRLPVLHFGYWHDLLLEWVEQGHITRDLADHCWDGSPADFELCKMLGWDSGWFQTERGHTELFPTFEYKELSRDADGFITYVNDVGVIERKREGIVSIPGEVDYLLKDRAAYETLFKPKMLFTMERLPNLRYFAEEFNAKNVDYPRGLHLGSVLGSIRSTMSVTGMSYLLADDYDLVREIVDTYAEMQYRCAEEVLKTGAKFDFAHYWEDICFRSGPLLSPAMFDDLCAKHYKKRNDLCRRYGIDIISLDCDGLIDELVPIWFENGVNTIFPLEVGVWGASVAPLRAKYGKELRVIGGMEKNVLRLDKAAVDKEIERLKPLIALGGYIPCPDHRLMPGTHWDLVQYYTEKIRTLAL